MIVPSLQQSFWNVQYFLITNSLCNTQVYECLLVFFLFPLNRFKISILQLQRLPSFSINNATINYFVWILTSSVFVFIDRFERRTGFEACQFSLIRLRFRLDVSKVSSAVLRNRTHITNINVFILKMYNYQRLLVSKNYKRVFVLFITKN